MRRSPIPALLLAVAVAVAVAMTVTACGDDGAVTTEGPPADPTRPSVAGDWILVSLVVDGAAVTLPPGDIEMTVALGEIRGDLGCNSFFGELDAADDGTLTVGSLGQTEMGCEEGRMAFESTYGQALAAATAWSVDPAGLTLTGPDVEIVYAQAPPPEHLPLEGTVWTFDTIFEGAGPDRAATNRADMDGVTLVIGGGDATLTGPECPGTVIAVEFDAGSEGEFRTGAGGDLPDSTGCVIVGLARDGLVAATGFTIDEHRLTFIGEPGETVGFTGSPVE